MHFHSCGLACLGLPWPFLVGFGPPCPSLVGLRWPSSVGLGLPWSASVIAAWPWLALASLAWPRPVLVFRGLLLPRPSSVLKQTRQCSRAEFFENRGQILSKSSRSFVEEKLGSSCPGRPRAESGRLDVKFLRIFVSPRNCFSFDGKIPGVGERVVFSAIMDKKRGKPKAVNV